MSYHQDQYGAPHPQIYQQHHQQSYGSQPQVYAQSPYASPPAMSPHPTGGSDFNPYAQPGMSSPKMSPAPMYPGPQHQSSYGFDQKGHPGSDQKQPVPQPLPSPQWQGQGQPPAQDRSFTQMQPQPTQGMLIAGGNRNAMNKPFDQKGEREWSHGLCDCFGDCGTCCLGWFCPCIVYAQNKTRLEHLASKGYPHPTGGESCNGDCCLHGTLTGLFGLGWILQIGGRGNTRARYRIEGGTCGDCCSSWCCSPCELTQESREIELEERSMDPHGAQAKVHQ